MVDNAYTNILTAWVCERAIEVLEAVAGHECDDLRARLEVDASEPPAWLRLSQRLAVPFLPGGLIAQFAGYHQLAELNWDRYRATYGNVGRLDLILEAEGDSTNRYKLAKQADVLMLLYVLGEDELLRMLNGLGYPTSRPDLDDTVDYYLARTAHGSTLSQVTHASILARRDPARGWQVFREALAADLDDTQGGTTQEGVHLGAMAATVDIITRAFAGYRTRGDAVVLAPRLPQGLGRAAFQIQHRGQRLHLNIDRAAIRIGADHCAASRSTYLDMDGTHFILASGQAMTFQYAGDQQSDR